MKLISSLLDHYSKIINPLLKYGVAAIILAVPLYPKFPLFNIPGVSVAIRLEDFLILFVFAVWFLSILPNLKKFFSEDINRAILVFWIVGLLSCLSAIYLTQGVSNVGAVLNWGRRIQYMVCFFIGMSALRNRENLNFYIKCLLVVIVYSFVVGLGQAYFRWPVITTQNDEYAKGQALFYMPGGHLISTFAGHYDMAAFLIFVLPLILVLMFSRREVLEKLFGKVKYNFSRILLFVISLMGLWLLVEAASRISIFAYLGTVVIVLFLNKKIKWIPFVLILTVVFTLLVGNSLESRYSNLIDVVRKRIIGLELVAPAQAASLIKPTPTPVVLITPSPSPTAAPVLEDRSTNIRLAVEWPRALRALSKNPLLGTGYSSITLATDNDYLRMLGEVGVLGTLAFGLVMIRILMELLSIFRFRKVFEVENIFVLSILGAIPGIFLTMVFIDVLEASKFAILFWLLLGITIGTIRNIKHEK